MSHRKNGAGFKLPIVFTHEGSKAVPGARHMYDDLPIKFAEVVDTIDDDPESGQLCFGIAVDGTGLLATNVAAADPANFNLPFYLRSGSANAPTMPGPQTVFGGIRRIQSAGVADNDSAILKPSTSGHAYSTTLDAWYAIRFALQATNAGECVVGWVQSGYAPADLATLPTDGIFFTKSVTGTDFDFKVGNTSAYTTITGVLALAGVTLQADTFINLAFTIRDGNVEVYVNGKRVGFIAKGDAHLPAGATALQAVAAVATNGASTKYMSIDHLVSAQARA